MGKRYNVTPVPEARAARKSYNKTGSVDADSSTRSEEGVQGKAVSHEEIEVALKNVVNIRMNGQKEGTNGDDENQLKKKEGKKERRWMVGTFAVFRFASGFDKFLMVLAAASCLLHGMATPLTLIIFGNVSDSFIDDGMFGHLLDGLMANVTALYPNLTRAMVQAEPSLIYPALDAMQAYEQKAFIVNRESTDLLEDMNQYAIWYCVIGVCVFVLAYTHTACWTASSSRQGQTIRSRLFHAILKQEISWYDTHDSGELSTRMTDDVSQIQAGIGDTLGLFLQYFSTFVTSFIVGIYHGWKLTLVIMSVMPPLMLAAAIMGKLSAIFTSKELDAYAKAGAVAEEVIGSIRTVVAFGGQRKEVARYAANLDDAKAMGIKRGAVYGFAQGLMFFMMFCAFSLAFWYGSSLVRTGELTGGTVLLVFMAVLTGTINLANAANNLQEFNQARSAACTVFALIDQKPMIDSSSEEGIKPANMKGVIEFREVTFSYPSRPDATVVSGLSLRVNVGQTVALVGASGCGKSTTVQLLQRFYDPCEGQVLIDGHDLREYHIKWLRQHVGVVSQEPVLFDTTICENISYGHAGVTQEQVEAACREANAHDFITNLPLMYDTVVGERGTQLSGGQKQRIAIARALVRDPKILLLDEATSALDTESEASVQAALDKAREGRTTIVIAHRLSTIKNADVIVSIDAGRVKEQGSHDELMLQEGIYHTLVTNQVVLDDDGHLLREVHGPLDVQHPVISNGHQRTISVGSTGCNSQDTSSMTIDLQEEEPQTDPDMGRVFRMNSPELPWIMGGTVGSFISGAVQPVFAVMLSEIIGVFAEPDVEKQKDEVKLYASMMVVVGVVAALSMFTMNYMFAYSGEKLTRRIRNLTFHNLLKQEIAYFDDPRNSTGALCTRLAVDASMVKGATGIRLGTVIRCLSSIGVALGIGFYFSWKLCLVILAFAPLIMVNAFITTTLSSGSQRASQANLEEAGRIVIQATGNMRTVASFTLEALFYDRYCEKTLGPVKRHVKHSHGFGFAAGFSHAMIFFAYAASFTFGAHLVRNGDLLFHDLFKVILAIVVAAMSVGQANSFAPDYGKAKAAAATILTLQDREPVINSYDESGDKLNDDFHSDMKMEKVEFVYPTRPNMQVLRGLSLSITSGQTVALVGSSGCGKSTVIQLLERFYDPLSGQLTLDGVDTTALNLQWLRGKMGIVSQEPTLFDASIQENIAYGDNSRNVPMHEIIQAAKDANIHNFIQTLPNGYDTNVGDNGTQLSGGQKQRVAIARALVRQPQILLLDEATSALDTESEMVVQHALDRAQEGRTSIVIAHRLSTIQNADKIIVIKNGQVAESGTHSELLAQKGFYHTLNMVQMRKAKQ